MSNSAPGPAQGTHAPDGAPRRSPWWAGPRLLRAVHSLRQSFLTGPTVTFGPTTVPIRRFRRQQERKPLLPYEVFAATDRYSPGTPREADEIIDRGWKHKTMAQLLLRPPIAWDDICAEHRSWAFHLHSWDALSPVLAAYQHTRELRYLRYALEIALDWANQYQSPESDTGFAWYDMAIGMRAYRLAYILDAVCRRRAFRQDAVATLLQCVAHHMHALADDDNFAAHSNHGFYLAAGQLAMARRLALLPGMHSQQTQAHQRMHALIQTQFTDEGVHREHSPEYHHMVHDTFHGLVRSGLLDGDDYLAMDDRIQEALVWFILPNGTLAMFGDTSHMGMDQSRDACDHIHNPALRFVYSRGAQGQPPPDTTRVFREAGYAIIRDRWPQGTHDFADCSYLAQTCCFHSRVHKHADDLAFVWYDHQQELLVDAGRFGYRDRSERGSELRAQGFYYAHPSRVYVETTRAHNAVEIDGRSYPRRKVTPYGSALKRVGRADDVHYIESSTAHFDRLQHTRVLYYRPRQWLLVYDALWDETQQPHDFHQRFHFAPELSVELDDAGPRVPLQHTDLQLHMRSLLPAEPLAFVHGQDEPDLLGWISRVDDEIMPCWTGGYGIHAAPRAEFATLLSFGQHAPVCDDAPAGDRHRLTLSWQQDGEQHQLNLPRLLGTPPGDPTQPLEIIYHQTANT